MFSGSLVAIVTPMCADGSIDLAAWDRLLDMHLASNTSGIVVGGTTGESPTVTDSELFELLRLARSRVGNRMALIAGAGSSSTSATVDKVRRLAQLAADGLLVVTPAYNKPTRRLYHTILRWRTRLHVRDSYNVPGRTCMSTCCPRPWRGCPAAAHRRHQRPGAVERIRELVALLPQGVCRVVGDDATARDSVLAGARGVISATANAVPRAMAI
jgi:4-hydroxy-tetrahydrodipicolinate synthase